MNQYDFNERLAFSSTNDGRDLEGIIKQMLTPGAAKVEKTDVALDKTGIDYIVTLRDGALVYIDLKMRSEGCSRFWVGEEEIALERWSVVPTPELPEGKVGWTLDEAKATHYTLHVFHPLDSKRVFLLPFQLLRMAFWQNGKRWYEVYRHERQSSGTWESECVFVPISSVIAAMRTRIVG